MNRFDPTDPELLRAARAAFPGFVCRAVARTPSTQELALAAARAGGAPGWCAVAEEQTRGRGRQGRRWLAAPGSALLVSVVVPAVAGGWTALACGIALAEALEATAPELGGRLALKWPNDLLAGDGKLAGLLLELPGGRRAAPVAVLGVGLNVHSDGLPESGPGLRPASLDLLCAPRRPPKREAILAALLTATGRRLERLSTGGDAAVAEVAAAWRGRAVGLGAAVVVETPQGRLTGVARDLDADGALLVDTPSGTHRLVAGDVHLLAADRLRG